MMPCSAPLPCVPLPPSSGAEKPKPESRGLLRKVARCFGSKLDILEEVMNLFTDVGYEPSNLTQNIKDSELWIRRGY